jgi:putative MATE family efflux protein
MKSVKSRGETDEARRQFILTGTPWKVLLSISLPLVIYNAVGNVFNIFDVVIASHLGAKIVSTVAFVSQIESMISALGMALAAGGGIITARYFGAGDYSAVSRHIATQVTFALALCGVLVAVIIPFGVPFLRLLKMPPDLLAEGTTYFAVETALNVFVFFNDIYFSVERAKGNTKAILGYNLVALPVKAALTVLFVFGFHGGILSLSAASAVAHALITAFALRNLSRPGDPLRLDLKAADWSRATLAPVIAISAPIFMEKFCFSFGKVVVNSMSALYGSMVVGALGISNRISGLANVPPNGVQDAESAIISQNLGNKNTPRAIAFFKCSFIANAFFGTLLCLVMVVFKSSIIGVFAKDDAAFALEIEKIYNYEISASIFLALSAAVMGLLYGFGYTKIAMVLNTVRLFGYRIPPLWIMQSVLKMGSESVGVAMFVSNALTGVTAIIVGIVFMRKLRASVNPSREK